MKLSMGALCVLMVVGLGLSSGCAKDRTTTADARRNEQATDRTGTETTGTTGIGGTLDNASLTAKVKSKLATDVKASTVTNIDVDSNNGVVTLSGTVPTMEAKTQAEQVAHSIDGVTKVENNLRVDNTRAGRK
jgi:hyperosmotically inducible protein